MYQANGIEENHLMAGFSRHQSALDGTVQLAKRFFLNEQTGHLYENTGSA
jgi:hypothetical protein